MWTLPTAIPPDFGAGVVFLSVLGGKFQYFAFVLTANLCSTVHPEVPATQNFGHYVHSSYASF